MGRTHLPIYRPAPATEPTQTVSSEQIASIVARMIDGEGQITPAQREAIDRALATQRDGARVVLAAATSRRMRHLTTLLDGKDKLLEILFSDDVLDLFTPEEHTALLGQINADIALTTEALREQAAEPDAVAALDALAGRREGAGETLAKTMPAPARNRVRDIASRMLTAAARPQTRRHGP